VHLKDTIRFGSRILSKRGRKPLYLIHFVTHDSNANCAHCLRGDRLRPGDDELTLDEIERVAAGLGPMLFVFLTGGEPFLRDDLPAILRAWHRHARVAKVQIPSNGLMRDRIVAYTDQMATECPETHIGVTISLDALGEEHDRIRRTKGLFEEATQTVKALQKLEKKHDNFDVNVTVTVSAYNQDTLIPLYDYIRNELGVQNIFNSLVRGEPRKQEALDVDIEKFEAFSDAIDADLISGRLTGYSRFVLSDFVNAKNLYSRKLIGRVVRENRRLIPCYAGSLAGVLFANGNVYPCEILEEPMGNVRDHDYRIDRIWTSQRAADVRKAVEGCFCTHECFISVNCLFNPRILARIAKDAAVLWAKRAWVGPGGSGGVGKR